MSLCQLEEKVRNLKCLLVGDIALDINTIGFYKGESREIEGLPIFRYPKKIRTYNPGGGGNLLFNLAHLGVETWACGIWGKPFDYSDILGTDWDRVVLERLLLNKGIHTDYMVEDETPVFGKHFLPIGHHLMRIDSATDPISERVKKQLLENISIIGPKCDFIVIADYNEEGNGVCTTRIIEKVVSLGKTLGIGIFGTSRERIHTFDDIAHLILNQEELKKVDVYIDSEKEKPNELLDAGLMTDPSNIDVSRLFYKTHSEYIILTRKEEGVSIYTNVNKMERIDIPTKPVLGNINPCGAGDTLAAIYSACFMAGMYTWDAIKMGMAGARYSVKQIFKTGYPSWRDIEVEFIEIYTKKEYDFLQSKWR